MKKIDSSGSLKWDPIAIPITMILELKLEMSPTTIFTGDMYQSKHDTHSKISKIMIRKLNFEIFHSWNLGQRSTLATSLAQKSRWYGPYDMNHMILDGLG